MEQSLNQYVDTLFTNMETFSQKEGLIGKPVTQGDKTFLPVMSITLGYGGGDTHSSKSKTASTSPAAAAVPSNMGGGALGVGAKLCADAVIVIDNNNVMLAPIAAPGGMNQVISKIPQIISSMGMGGQQSGQQQQGAQQNNQQNSPMGG